MKDKLDDAQVTISSEKTSKKEISTGRDHLRTNYCPYMVRVTLHQILHLIFVMCNLCDMCMYRKKFAYLLHLSPL